MPTLLILVPPSEAKTPGGARGPSRGIFDDVLDGPRAEVIAEFASALQSASTRRREIILNARGPLMERAFEAATLLASGRARVRPAWQRYSGVVWSHLDPASLSPGARRRILIPSGIYGLTTGEDRIADFRLKMNVGVGTLGTMASYWRARLTPVVAAHQKTATIVSLLPKEHEAALDLGTLARSRGVLRVVFSDEAGGARVGHDAKAVKGILARTLLLQGLAPLETFEWQGWRARRRDGEFHIVAPGNVP